MNKVVITIVALILAAAAGFGIYTFVNKNKDQSTAESVITEINAAKPGIVVAKVNNQPITMGDLQAFVKMIPPQYQQMPMETLYPQLVQQLVVSKLVEAKANSLNLANDPEVVEKIEQAKKQIIEGTFIQREVNKKINDGKLKEAYQAFIKENPSEEEVHARHILVDSEDAAKAIIAKLNESNGKNFEELAKTSSKDANSGQNGGDLGYFTKQEMIPEFSNAAFAMNKGSFSSTPVKSSFGWHVIKVEDKRKRPQPTFDELKPQIGAQLSRTAYQDIVTDLQKNATIELFDMKGKPLPKAEGEQPAAPTAVPAAPETKTAPASKAE